MHNVKAAPLMRLLVVHDEVWLGYKRLEALFDAELAGAFSGVFAAPSTPAIQSRASLFQFVDVRDDIWHWDTFGTDAADEGVVYVNVNNGCSHG